MGARMHARRLIAGDRYGATDLGNRAWDRNRTKPRRPKVLRKLDVEAIRGLAAALPDMFREVVVLRELDDLSYREIAAIADAPVGAVMSRLERGRAMLRGT
jgi:RNA polymerase sigma-70 factor (ECF subfamily)